MNIRQPLTAAINNSHKQQSFTVIHSHSQSFTVVHSCKQLQWMTHHVVVLHTTGGIRVEYMIQFMAL